MNTFNKNRWTQKSEPYVLSSGGFEFISRLDFIKKIVLLTGAIVSGCTPVRVLLNSYPDKYDDDKKLSRQILGAFVLTIIPGGNPDDPDLCKIFNDEFYPFYKFCGFFTSDLCGKSKKLFGTEKFFELSFNQRTKVIQDGLDDDVTTSRLYTSAIYIAQVSYFSCIYNDDKACSLIDFPNSYEFMETDMYYKDFNKMLADEVTSSGNYS